jgi:hypothetical protein
MMHASAAPTRGLARPPRARATGFASQRGYALLLIMFFAALLAASAMTVVPNILTEGRRQNEIEMIWRGKQYIRGVKLYNRKLGKFPTSLDDLTLPKTGSIRFMRAAYKDPMNREDGSWRLIYIGPAGQLIGSLKPPDPTVPGAGGLGVAASTVASNSTGGVLSGGTALSPGASSSSSGFSGSFGSSSFGAGSNNSSNSFNSSFGSSSSTNPSGTPCTPGATPCVDPMLDPIAPSGDAPTIIGGNIVGVGSKINKHSIQVYEKAKNYLLFEFVWNPAKDAAAAIQQLNAPGSGGLGTPIGAPATGQAPGTTAPPPTAQPPQQ